MILFQQNNTLFLAHFSSPHQAVFPVGSDILAHLFLRFYVDYGIAIFSLLGYFVIILSVYAISRYYASSKIALLSMIVVASMPELVLQATSTKNDIMVGSVGMFCLLVGHRLYKKTHIRDLILLGLGLAFGISVKTTFAAFAMPFIILFGGLLLNKHGWQFWQTLIRNHWQAVLASVIPILILSQAWLFIYNHNTFGNWSGPTDFVQSHRNKEGLFGATANMTRYFFESIDFLMPVDLVIKRYITPEYPSYHLQTVYETIFNPIFDKAGTKYPKHTFRIVWRNQENYAWFGPFVLLMIYPSLIYAMWRGTATIRMLTLTLLGYMFFVTWQVAWMNWNNRFFTLFFVGGGVCLAFLLENKLNFTWLRKAIELIAIVILFYAVIFNEHKPIFNRTKLDEWIRHPISTIRHPTPLIKQVQEKNIWAQSNWGHDRFYFTNRLYPEYGVKQVLQNIEKDSHVRYILSDGNWIYPYMIHRPDVRFTISACNPLEAHVEQTGSPPYKMHDVDYLLYLGCKTAPVMDDEHSMVLWKSSPSTAERYSGFLIRFD